jgi:hypothetical protein
MAASDYVGTYLHIWCWINDTFTVARVRNYLQSGLGGKRPERRAPIPN